MYLLQKDDLTKATGCDHIELMLNQKEFKIKLESPNPTTWEVTYTRVSDGHSRTLTYGRHLAGDPHYERHGYTAGELQREFAKDFLKLLCDHYGYTLYKSM